MDNIGDYLREVKRDDYVYRYVKGSFVRTVRVSHATPTKIYLSDGTHYRRSDGTEIKGRSHIIPLSYDEACIARERDAFKREMQKLTHNIYLLESKKMTIPSMDLAAINEIFSKAWNNSASGTGR